MNIEQFRATGKDCSSVGDVIGDDCLVNVAGRVYMNTLYIARWNETAQTPPPNGATWLLQLGRDETAGELAELEAKLYEWAVSEGYFE